MKQQPIALYTGNYTIGFLNSDKTLKVGEPLYTAPRELSDEEIYQILSKELECVDDEYLKRSAKAILKKASEK